MKSYILLRNNQEYGPYSLKELKALGLHSTDLLWIEGESRSWSLPEEMSGLNDKIMVTEKATAATTSSACLKPFLGSQTNVVSNTANESAYYFSERKEPLIDSYVMGDDEPIFVRRTHHKKAIGIGTGVFGFIVLLIGVALCVFMIKATIKSFHYEAAPSVAREIKDDGVVSVSSNSYAAKSISVAPVQSNNNSSLVMGLDSSISKNKILKTLAPAINSKARQHQVVTSNTPVENFATNNDSTVVGNGNSDIKSTTDDAEKKPVANVKPSLQIEANDYKVGFLGGISNLELSVTNPSSQTIENATIVVEFLKPNGSVVKSQSFTVNDITAGATKTIAVPSTSRGVKVRYHIASAGE